MTPPDATGSLSPRDRLLVLSLARGASHDEAATVAGVSKATVTRRLRETRIRRAIEETHDLLFDQALGLAVTALDDAFQVLVAIAKDSQMPPTPRVTAAGKIAELALRFRDSHELLSRIEQLEATFAA